MKKKSLLLVAVSGLSLGLAGLAHAQVLTDGGFESSGVGTSVNNKNTNGFNSTSSPGWANVGFAANDSGIQNGTPTTGLPGIANASQAGNYFAFEASTDYATNGGAYQISGTQAGANDTLTLTWWAANAYSPAAGAPIQVVDLLASTDGSFTDSTILASTITGTGAQVSGYALPAVTTAGGGNGTAYQEYTLTTSVPVLDAGDFVGVSFGTTGPANNYYASYDSFTLTDSPVVPEPSSLALILVGVSGLFLMNRFRRSLV
jgi:hypothetical protein